MPQPTNLGEAIGQLSTESPYDQIETSLLSDFALDLVFDYPELVMAEVVAHRHRQITEQLQAHIGELG